MKRTHIRKLKRFTELPPQRAASLILLMRSIRFDHSNLLHHRVVAAIQLGAISLDTGNAVLCGNEAARKEVAELAGAAEIYLKTYK